MAGPGRTGDGDVHRGRLSATVPVVSLACTSCQLVYVPDLADFSAGNTGCPRCGGWTWIAQLGTAGDGGGGST